MEEIVEVNDLIQLHKRTNVMFYCMFLGLNERAGLLQAQRFLLLFIMLAFQKRRDTITDLT